MRTIASMPTVQSSALRPPALATLLKIEPSTLVLAGANIYTVGTIDQGGTLCAGTINTFVPNGSYIVNGGLLDLDGHAPVVATLPDTGGSIALGGAQLTLEHDFCKQP